MNFLQNFDHGSDYRLNCPPPPYSVASYRTPPSDSGYGGDAPHGYDASGLAAAFTRIHRSVDEKDRRVIIHVKDAHDKDGNGMLFILNMTHSFKHVFDAFKAASCKTCRPANGMTFKALAKKLKEDDAPVIVPKLKHNQTMSIKVYSNAEGLKCAACNGNGYPTTNGKQLDGNIPQLNNVQEPCGRLICLVFRDPNQTCIHIPATSTYQLRHAMGDYARRVEVDVRSLYFSYDNEAVAEDDTPEELGMRNNSIIDVNMHFTSG